jgi:hypothetical protein
MAGLFFDMGLEGLEIQGSTFNVGRAVLRLHALLRFGGNPSPPRLRRGGGEGCAGHSNADFGWVSRTCRKMVIRMRNLECGLRNWEQGRGFSVSGSADVRICSGLRRAGAYHTICNVILRKSRVSIQQPHKSYESYDNSRNYHFGIRQSVQPSPGKSDPIQLNPSKRTNIFTSERVGLCEMANCNPPSSDFGAAKWLMANEIKADQSGSQ